MIGAVVAVGVGSVAYATIPSASGGMIHVCYKAGDELKQNGATLTVIDKDSGSECKAGYTELSFNQQGPAGVPGPKGDTGDKGDPGDPAQLSGGSVENSHLAANSVTSDKIEDGTIRGVDIGNHEVVGNHLAEESVMTSKIALGAVAADRLATNSVNSAKIIDGTITGDDVATGAIAGDHLANNSVLSRHLTVTAGQSTHTTEYFSSGATTFGSVPLVTSDGSRVMLNANAQLRCFFCDVGSNIEVAWQLFDGGLPLGEEYRGVITHAAPLMPIHVSYLAQTAGTDHNYNLRITIISRNEGALEVSSAVVTAIDLG